MTGELWTHRLLATDPTSFRKRFSKLCCPLQRRLKLQRIFRLGPITGDSLRATHLSREPARYRVLLAHATKQAVSHGVPWPVSRPTQAETIDLCLWLFPWAKFRRRKAAVKMHTLLDLHGNIPAFIRVTSGDVHDPRRAQRKTSWTRSRSYENGWAWRPVFIKRYRF
jgi:hypothetical protein